MSAGGCALLIAAAIAVGIPGAGRACGACIEDKVAATYDHAVIKRAIERHQQVVFVAVDGNVDGEYVAKRVATAKVAGVVPGTLRTSVTPTAFSFALEPQQQPARAVAGFSNAVGDSRARMTTVRLVRDGKLIEP